ncbi:PQQ-binding-like beta-propeller repeat protein [Thalassoglobus sp. JC818]|uniref:PQQ-binding-like beta-propeller repeat protein n=1 Tax=Thalassoglobus sp. JC818 TaxID=3232136 RepID=UPI00345AE02C
MVRLGTLCWGVIFTLLGLGSSALAGDWPQILGPNRNGIASADEKLADEWPSGGPPVIWEKNVGSGYAGVAVEGDDVILFHRVKRNEVVELLSAETGESKWKVEWPTDFYPQVGGGDGPLCVPVIAGNRIVAFGAEGVLTCIDRISGKQLWQVDTQSEFGAREGYFGFGSTPLVIGERVIVNVGGSKENAGVVGFDLESGEVLWSRTEEPASYSAPVECSISGMPHVMIITRYKCMLMDPENGYLRFQFPFGQRGPTVNGASPVVLGDHVLVTSSYGIGSKYVKFDFFGSKEVWETERTMASQYCTPIVIDEKIYVIDGRDDVPPADLKCLELKTGKLVWSEPNFGYGTLIHADGKFLACLVSGEVLLGRMEDTRMKVLSRARLFRSTMRALPALSNGRLYLRDQSTLKCYSVAPGL